MDDIRPFHETNDVDGFDAYIRNRTHTNIADSICTCIRMGFSKGACCLLDHKVDDLKLCLFTAMLYDDIAFVHECLTKYPIYDYKIENYLEYRDTTDNSLHIKNHNKPWILWAQSVKMTDFLLNRIPRRGPCERLQTCTANPNRCRCDILNYRKFSEQTIVHELLGKNSSGQATEILTYLLSRGLDLNLGSMECPLIHHTIYYRDLDSLKLLQSYGANLRALDKYNHTVLHIAVMNQALDCLHYLLQQPETPFLLLQKMETDEIPLILAFNQHGPESEIYKTIFQAHLRLGINTKSFEKEEEL